MDSQICAGEESCREGHDFRRKGEETVWHPFAGEPLIQFYAISRWRKMFASLKPYTPCSVAKRVYCAMFNFMDSPKGRAVRLILPIVVCVSCLAILISISRNQDQKRQDSVSQESQQVIRMFKDCFGGHKKTFENLKSNAEGTLAVEYASWTTDLKLEIWPLVSAELKNSEPGEKGSFFSFQEGSDAHRENFFTIAFPAADENLGEWHLTYNGEVLAQRIFWNLNNLPNTWITLQKFNLKMKPHDGDVFSLTEHSLIEPNVGVSLPLNEVIFESTGGDVVLEAELIYLPAGFFDHTPVGIVALLILITTGIFYFALYGYEARNKLLQQRDWIFSTLEEEPDIVCIFDKNGKLLFLNKAGKSLVGAKNSKVLDVSVLEYLNLTRNNLNEIKMALIEEGGWTGTLDFHIAVSGEVAPHVVRINRIQGDINNKNPIFFTIARSKSASLEFITESDISEKYEAFFRNSHDGICRISFENSIDCNLPKNTQIAAMIDKAIVEECNQEFSHSHSSASPDRMVGRHLREVVFDHERVLQVIFSKFHQAGYELGDLELKLKTAENEDIFIDFHCQGFFKRGKLVGAWITQHDLTERNLLLDKIETQKIEAELGQFGASIAHHFNNELQRVVHRAELILRSEEEDSVTYDNAKDIMDGAGIARALSQDIMTLSGTGQFVKELVDLNEFVRSEIAEIDIPSKETVTLNLFSGIPRIRADRLALKQLLSCLVRNASESSQIGIPHIRISTDVIDSSDLGNRDFIRGTTFPKGPIVCLKVSDNGSGILYASSKVAFTPFKGTKHPSRGLGLAVVSGVCKGHGWDIWCDTEEAVGTTMGIVIPVDKVEHCPPEDLKLRSELPAAKIGLLSQYQVLVVDDEDPVRLTTELVLRGAGFQVAGAESGQAALEMVRCEPERFNAMVLDMTMPGMDGIETCQKIRQIRPTMPTVFVSGYSRRLVAEEATADPLSAFLQKPYESNTLMRSLLSLLQA